MFLTIVIIIAILIAITMMSSNRDTAKLQEKKAKNIEIIDKLLLEKNIMPLNMAFDNSSNNCIAFTRNKIWCGIIDAKYNLKEKVIENFSTANYSCNIDIHSFGECCCIAVDIQSKKIAIIKLSDSISVKLFDFASIVSVELIKNGITTYKKSTTGTVGRALIGGVLAGGIGAIVGGATGKQNGEEKCTSLITKIMLNDIKEPMCEIHWHKDVGYSNIEDSPIYKTAQKSVDIIKTIIHTNDSEAKTQVSSDSQSTADEIMKLHKLKELGAITVEEYELQKSNLLSNQSFF